MLIRLVVLREFIFTMMYENITVRFMFVAS